MNLEEIRRVTQQATPGPWWRSRVGATGGAVVRTTDGNRSVARLEALDRDLLDLPGDVGAERASRAIEQTQADAEFIALAREAIPWLLDIAEAAQRVTSEYTAWAEDHNDGTYAYYRSDGLASACVTLRSMIADSADCERTETAPTPRKPTIQAK